MQRSQHGVRGESDLGGEVDGARVGIDWGKRRRDGQGERDWEGVVHSLEQKESWYSVGIPAETWGSREALGCRRGEWERGAGGAGGCCCWCSRTFPTRCVKAGEKRETCSQFESGSVGRGIRVWLQRTRPELRLVCAEDVEVTCVRLGRWDHTRTNSAGGGLGAGKGHF